MTPQEKARTLRPLIVKAVGSLEDDDALEAVELFPTWSGESFLYAKDQRVNHGGILYRCLQEHISQPTWTPTDASSLWTKVIYNPETIDVWEQPDSTNPYPKGAKVYFPTENDPIYISTIDNNVWAPNVYGWELYSD